MQKDCTDGRLSLYQIFLFFSFSSFPLTAVLFPEPQESQKHNKLSYPVFGTSHHSSHSACASRRQKIVRELQKTPSKCNVWVFLVNILLGPFYQLGHTIQAIWFVLGFLIFLLFFQNLHCFIFHFHQHPFMLLFCFEKKAKQHTKKVVTSCFAFVFSR